MREADVRSVKRFFERVCAELNVFSPGVLSSKYGLAISSSYHYLAVASKLGIIERVRYGLYRCRDSGARPSEAAATPVARVDGDRLVLELRLEAVESLRESIERKLRVLEQQLYAIEQKLSALFRGLEEPELETRPSDEEIESRILEVVDRKRLVYVAEIRDELTAGGLQISWEYLFRALRKLVAQGRLYEIAPKLFSTKPDIAVDEIERKYQELNLGKIPRPVTGRPLYRATKSYGKITVLPNSW